MSKQQNIKSFTDFNSYGDFDCLSFKERKLNVSKPNHLGFYVFPFLRLQIESTSYNVLKSILENLQITICIVIQFFVSFKTKDLLKDLEKILKVFRR